MVGREEYGALSTTLIQLSRWREEYGGARCDVDTTELVVGREEYGAAWYNIDTAGRKRRIWSCLVQYMLIRLVGREKYGAS